MNRAMGRMLPLVALLSTVFLAAHRVDGYVATPADLLDDFNDLKAALPISGYESR